MPVQCCDSMLLLLCEKLTQINFGFKVTVQLFGFQDETDEAILDETNANLIAHEDDAALLTPTTVTAPKTMVERYDIFSLHFNFLY